VSARVLGEAIAVAHHWFATAGWEIGRVVRSKGETTMAKAKPELSALSELAGIGTELDESQLAQVNGGYYWDFYHWEDFAPGGWAY